MKIKKFFKRLYWFIVLKEFQGHKDKYVREVGFRWGKINFNKYK